LAQYTATQRPQENRKKHLLPNSLVEDWKLEAPTPANCALVLMPALRAAVAQEDCPKLGEAYNAETEKTPYNRDLLRFLTSSRRFS